MTLTAVFAALLCICSQIVVPIGMVPITLQTAAVYIIALALGPGLGTAAIAIYLLLGAVGLPVFSGGHGGIAVLVGPTAGFLWGFLLAPVVCGLVMKRLNRAKLVPYIVALIPTFLVVFGLGLLWLKYSLSLTWGAAMMAGVIPFLLGDALKILLSALIARGLYRSGFGYGAK